jgi:hypothetical protein
VCAALRVTAIAKEQSIEDFTELERRAPKSDGDPLTGM